MKAFGIFDVLSIHDEEGMARYREQVVPVVEQFGGRYVAVGGPLDPVEGVSRPTFPVIIEFPDMDCARAWYGSAEYAELKDLRHRSAHTQAYFLQAII